MIDTNSTIDIRPISQSRIKDVDFETIAFGRIFSDHMVEMDYENGEWKSPVIRGFSDLSMNPASLVLHYGQAIFEGMKAFKGQDGEIRLFRPDQNIKRFNKSAERMCMPQMPEQLFHDVLIKLVQLDKNWVPSKEGSSLYLRPFMYASDEYVGVKPSNNYKFIIFSCPVNAYYSGAVKVKIEKHYTRSAPGGTGFAKAAGNYAGSLYPAKLAQADGYDQLVWTDAREHKYIEESGTMNIVFRSGNTVFTPALSDSILAGITRASIIQLAKDFGYKVEERKVSVREVEDLLKAGKLDEAFGAGTAATIAPISVMGFDGHDYELSDYTTWELASKLQAHMEGMKRGTVEDVHDWTVKI